MLCGIQSGMRDKEWRAEETPFKKLAVKGRSMSWRQLEGKILVGTVSVSLKSLSLHRSGTSNSTSFLWFSLSTESLARPPCWLWVWTLCEMYLCFPCHRVKDEQVVVFSYSVVSDSWDPIDCSMPGFPVFTISQILLQVISFESVMPSNHLLLCRPLLLLPSVFPSIRVFAKEFILWVRWQRIGVLVSVLPVNTQDWFPLGLTGSRCCTRDSEESSPAPQFESLNSMTLSLLYGLTLIFVYDC